METLTEDDLDYLTTVENKLLRMRKRETAHKNILCKELTSSIKEIHSLRIFLQLRFGKTADDFMRD